MISTGASADPITTSASTGCSTGFGGASGGFGFGLAFASPGFIMSSVGVGGIGGGPCSRFGGF